MGPYHPAGPSPPKAALVSVTRSGVLRLLFQQPENKWGETHTDLEAVTTSNDLLTHASFCSDRGDKGDRGSDSLMLHKNRRH